MSSPMAWTNIEAARNIRNVNKKIVSSATTPVDSYPRIPWTVRT